MDLGEKIRQARLEAGFSQRQLCGEEITRNMLSQIEHGTAKPSMKTLAYLAGRLERPMSYFLDEQTPASDNRLAETMALLAAAEEAIAQKKYPYARQLLERSGADLPAALERQRLLLLSRIPGEDPAGIAAALPSLDEELLLRAEAAIARQDWDRAGCMLAAAEDQDAPQWHFLRGRMLLARKQYTTAAVHLAAAEDTCPAAVPMLELCYRELGDFRRAYEYACKQK